MHVDNGVATDLGHQRQRESSGEEVIGVHAQIPGARQGVALSREASVDGDVDAEG